MAITHTHVFDDKAELLSNAIKRTTPVRDECVDDDLHRLVKVVTLFDASLQRLAPGAYVEEAKGRFDFHGDYSLMFPGTYGKPRKLIALLKRTLQSSKNRF